MNVSSLEWVLGILIVSAIFFQLAYVRHRQALFALCSFGFLVTQSLDWPAWLLLIVFLGTGYAVAKVLVRGHSKAVLVTYLCLLVAAFVFFKQYVFVTVLLPPVLFTHKIALVGLSYMLFRQIHLVVDAHQGQIEQLSLWNYLNYQLNLFGLLAGPIQRYQEFCENWGQLKPILRSRDEILQGYLRLFTGIIKVLGLATICLSAYTSVSSVYLSSGSGWRTVGQFLAVLYLYPAYLYLNFSGYCDIVIAGAALLGMRMPENFNYPFMSRNIGDLWTRWHRTLGLWVRDYLFTPLFKGSVERWPRFAISLSFAAYLVAFALAGLWHGSTWNFLVFGLLNGAGIAAAKAWEMVLLRRRGRRGLKAYLQEGRVKAIAIGATAHYFSFTVIFWSHGMTESIAILKHMVRAVI